MIENQASVRFEAYPDPPFFIDAYFDLYPSLKVGQVKY
jgi:hypothetical protein